MNRSRLLHRNPQDGHIEPVRGALIPVKVFNLVIVSKVYPYNSKKRGWKK